MIFVEFQHCLPTLLERNVNHPHVHESSIYGTLIFHSTESQAVSSSLLAWGPQDSCGGPRASANTFIHVESWWPPRWPGPPLLFYNALSVADSTDSHYQLLVLLTHKISTGSPERTPDQRVVLIRPQSPRVKLCLWSDQCGVIHL